MNAGKTNISETFFGINQLKIVINKFKNFAEVKKFEILLRSCLKVLVKIDAKTKLQTRILINLNVWASLTKTVWCKFRCKTSNLPSLWFKGSLFFHPDRVNFSTKRGSSIESEREVSCQQQYDEQPQAEPSSAAPPDSLSHQARNTLGFHNDICGQTCGHTKSHHDPPLPCYRNIHKVVIKDAHVRSSNY